MATWELFREGTKEQDLINVEYVDSANPFGDYVIAQIEDNLGQKFDLFEYATEIEVTVTPDGGSQISKFDGFVVERRENDQQGQDMLEVEAYSFDQFLRQNDVSNDQTGKLISSAIEDIIKTDTPVTFNSAKVEVVDDFELRRSLQDERVETALQILSFVSGNEGFGVNDNLEFFFRPREQDTVARGIDNTEWFDYDIPERGKEAINEVEVRFDDGDQSVVVDDAKQKLRVQDSLNLLEPATQRGRIARPAITNAQDAEQAGRRFLKLKNVTLTGTITTFGLFEAEPFDTINVEIIPRGIDNEFVITQVEYDWGNDETRLTIVENRGYQEDLFIRLAEKTERIDLRETEPQAVEDRIITTDVAASIRSKMRAGLDVGPITETTTNDAVDEIVAGWRDNGNPTISEIVVGDTATELSRSDSALENQTNSASVNELLESSNSNPSVFYSASISQANVKEIGLKDASGTLFARGIFDNPVTIPTSVSVEFIVDDASDENSVVTNTGQTAIRDIIADNNPQTPTRYAFGISSVPPSESDTSLNNEIRDTKLNRTNLQQIDTADEFLNSLSIDDDVPVQIDEINNSIKTVPVTHVTEAEDASFDGTVFNNTQFLSDGTGINIPNLGNFVEFTFTVDHTIPANSLQVGAYAFLDFFDGEFSFYFDGFEYLSTSFGTGPNEQTIVGGFNGVNSVALEEGTEHTLLVETTAPDGSANAVIDALFAFDSRPKYGVSAPNTSTFNGQTYSTPELYPSSVSVSFPEINSRRKLTELELVQTWNDTSNDAAVTLNLGSQSNTVNNPQRSPSGNIRETLTVAQANASRTGSIDITLSRFNDAATSSTFPREGDGNQEVSFHIVDGNPDAVTRSNIGEATTRAFFQSGALTGNTLREAGQEAGADLLTRSIFADVDPEDDNIIGAEQIQFIPE